VVGWRLMVVLREGGRQGGSSGSSPFLQCVPRGRVTSRHKCDLSQTIITRQMLASRGNMGEQRCLSTYPPVRRRHSCLSLPINCVLVRYSCLDDTARHKAAAVETDGRRRCQRLEMNATWCPAARTYGFGPGQTALGLVCCAPLTSNLCSAQRYRKYKPHSATTFASSYNRKFHADHREPSPGDRYLSRPMTLSHASVNVGVNLLPTSHRGDLRLIEEDKCSQCLETYCGLQAGGIATRNRVLCELLDSCGLISGGSRLLVVYV
jgi:hypothetical protein